jgi:hypothetical protein
MKILYTLTAAVLLLTSCSKILEKQEQNIVTQVITDGRWSVSKYLEGTTDRASEFSPYQFQFQSNDSIDAIRNNVVEKKGYWQVNTSARTITSFFTNASAPLPLLNGTWNIINTTWTTVEATQTINGTETKLYLQKL